MTTRNRPLSPHLQVYRPQLTSVLSISHRASGVILAAGSVILAIWLLALASGPATYATVANAIGSPPGKILMFLFTLALYYHLCNGVRHLFWDAGHGFELDAAYASGRAVCAISVVLTALTWAVVFNASMGAGS